MNDKKLLIEEIQKQAVYGLKYFRENIDDDPDSYSFTSRFNKNKDKILNEVMIDRPDWLDKWRCADGYCCYSPYPGSIPQDELPEEIIFENGVPINVNIDYFKGYKTLESRWNYIKKIIDPFYLDDFSDNEFGNPTQFNFRPGKITTVQITLILFYLGLIDKFTPINRSNNKNPFNIIEIGGGYGGCARAYKTYFPNCTYIIIDLERCLYLEHYYLSMSFPGAKIATAYTIDTMHPNIATLNEITNEYDFMLLPPCFIEKFENKSIDLFINTNSLPEMNVDQILYYYAQMKRLCRGYFYQHNRITHKLPNVNFSIVDWPTQKWETILCGNLLRGYMNFVDLILKAPD